MDYSSLCFNIAISFCKRRYQIKITSSQLDIIQQTNTYFVVITCTNILDMAKILYIIYIDTDRTERIWQQNIPAKIYIV